MPLYTIYPANQILNNRLFFSATMMNFHSFFLPSFSRIVNPDFLKNSSTSSCECAREYASIWYLVTSRPARLNNIPILIQKSFHLGNSLFKASRIIRPCGFRTRCISEKLASGCFQYGRLNRLTMVSTLVSFRGSFSDIPSTGTNLQTSEWCIFSFAKRNIFMSGSTPTTVVFGICLRISMESNPGPDPRSRITPCDVSV